MEDLSDLEREEQLRSFWRDNWLTIVGGVAIGLGGIAGWRYWQGHTRGSAEQAEAAYSGVLESLTANKREDAASGAKALREAHPSSPYADQADLALARTAVDRQDLEVAASLLRGVMDSSRDTELRRIARMRLARVLIEQDKADEAMSLLDVSDAGAFSRHYQEIRGDALAAKGDAAAARDAYEAALAAPQSAESIDRDYIELKRDALPPAKAADVTEAATPVSATPPGVTLPGGKPDEAP